MSEFFSPAQIAKEAKSAYQSGDYVSAAKSFKAAREGYLSAENHLMAAEMANNCSVALLNAGNNQEALLILNGVDFVFAKNGDRKRQAMTLANKATALEALGLNQEAENTYWEAAGILKELGETELRLPLMQSISSLQLRTGRQFQAIASMFAGLENIKKPTFKHRILKRLLQFPLQIISKQSKELSDGSSDNPR